jgi:hypothetical protein
MHILVANSQQLIASFKLPKNGRYRLAAWLRADSQELIASLLEQIVYKKSIAVLARAEVGGVDGGVGSGECGRRREGAKAPRATSIGASPPPQPSLCN